MGAFPELGCFGEQFVDVPLLEQLFADMLCQQRAVLGRDAAGRQAHQFAHRRLVDVFFCRKDLSSIFVFPLRTVDRVRQDRFPQHLFIVPVIGFRRSGHALQTHSQHFQRRVVFNIVGLQGKAAYWFVRGFRA